MFELDFAERENGVALSREGCHLHFTEDELIARVDCIDKVILISSDSTNGFTAVFRGVGRVIFTNSMDAVVLTL